MSAALTENNSATGQSVASTENNSATGQLENADRKSWVDRPDFPTVRSYLYAKTWAHFAQLESRVCEFTDAEALLTDAEQDAILERRGFLVKDIIFHSQKKTDYFVVNYRLQNKRGWKCDVCFWIYRSCDEKYDFHHMIRLHEIHDTYLVFEEATAAPLDICCGEWILEMAHDWQEASLRYHSIIKFAKNTENSLHPFIVEEPMLFYGGRAEAVAALRHPDADQLDVNTLLTEVRQRFGLNLAQTSAICQAVEQRISLIQGPPGTGKSVTAVALAWFWENVDEKILVTCHSNQPLNAVTRKNLQHLDARNVCRIVSVKARDKMLPEDVDMLSPCLFPDVARAQAIAKKYTPTANAFPKHVSKFLREAYAQARVFVATCNFIGSGGTVLREINYSRVVIDEAAQLCEPDAVKPLCFTTPFSSMCLIGDHRQLPPTVRSVTLRRQNQDRSLFERLLEGGVVPMVRLTEQYRMLPCLTLYPSKAFIRGPWLLALTRHHYNTSLIFSQLGTR
jgi:hypothetical protein